MNKLLFKSRANPRLELYETYIKISGFIYLKNKEHTFLYKDIKSIKYNKDKHNPFSTLIIALFSLLLESFIPWEGHSVLSITLKEKELPLNFSIYLRKREMNFMLDYVNRKLD